MDKKLTLSKNNTCKKIGFYGILDDQVDDIKSIIGEKYSFVEKGVNDCDFLFVGPYERALWHPIKDQVRIFFTFEPMTPSMNLFDYAIGFEVMNYLGKDNKPRYLRYPYCYASMYPYKDNSAWDGLTFAKATEVLKEKQNFCNFMYSHASPSGEREKLFHTLCKYKKVDSAGTFLNNMDDGFVIERMNPKKLDFIKSYKFTIACESVVHAGFCTEKIGHAFITNSIPIYFGDPLVVKCFNPKSFINCNEYKSFDEVLERVKYLDTHDDEYIKMLCEPKLNNRNAIEISHQQYKEFLWFIIGQDKENAYRRDKFYYDYRFEKEINNLKDIYSKYNNMFIVRLKRKLINVLRVGKK